MKIALYYRHIDPADRQAFESLLAELAAARIETVEVHDGDSVDTCDYLFSIGGDGTLLSSVQFVRSGNPADFPPILGINFGHLGFLTTVGREGLKAMVDDLVAGRFTLEERTLLQLATSGRQATVSYALNEVFVHRGEDMSLLRTEVYVDNLYVATYAGDGVIVATPTGSTAYSLSCGGPILTPDSRCLAITPISAHTLTLRPIIVPDTARLRLNVKSGPFTLGVDSRREAFGEAVSFDLQRAPFSIRLIRTAGQNFFSAIRDKLMWGTEVRHP
ncbi:MAG: NAD(+)/NADH kinase [Bacteroidales bacterium]|nr:NAD(+)/NADH kinase [Bacteroidales bacterium]